MEKILLLLVLCTVVKAVHKHHPRFPRSYGDLEDEVLKKENCSSDNEELRHKMIDQAKCGDPKEVFVTLSHNVAHKKITPSGIWIKRCVGICDFESFGSSCVPTKSVIRHIPIRTFDLKTKKEYCSTYPVEEHKQCKCCAESPEKCGAPRVFNSRKCSCQCPDLEARRKCYQKRSEYMKWNRYKCKCEEKRRPRLRT